MSDHFFEQHFGLPEAATQPDEYATWYAAAVEITAKRPDAIIAKLAQEIAYFFDHIPSFVKAAIIETAGRFNFGDHLSIPRLNKASGEFYNGLYVLETRQSLVAVDSEKELGGKLDGDLLVRALRTAAHEAGHLLGYALKKEALHDNKKWKDALEKEIKHQRANRHEALYKGYRHLLDHIESKNARGEANYTQEQYAEEAIAEILCHLILMGARGHKAGAIDSKMRGAYPHLWPEFCVGIFPEIIRATEELKRQRQENCSAVYKILNKMYITQSVSPPHNLRCEIEKAYVGLAYANTQWGPRGQLNQAIDFSSGGFKGESLGAYASQVMKWLRGEFPNWTFKAADYGFYFTPDLSGLGVKQCVEQTGTIRAAAAYLKEHAELAEVVEKHLGISVQEYTKRYITPLFKDGEIHNPHYAQIVFGTAKHLGMSQESEIRDNIAVLKDLARLADILGKGRHEAYEFFTKSVNEAKPNTQSEFHRLKNFHGKFRRLLKRMECSAYTVVLRGANFGDNVRQILIALDDGEFETPMKGPLKALPAPRVIAKRCVVT